MPENPYQPPTRRWFQFRLKRLLLAVACFAVASATWKFATHPDLYYYLGFDISAQVLVMVLACFIGGAGAGVLFERWWVAWVASVAVTIFVFGFLL